MISNLSSRPHRFDLRGHPPQRAGCSEQFFSNSIFCSTTPPRCFFSLRSRVRSWLPRISAFTHFSLASRSAHGPLQRTCKAFLPSPTASSVDRNKMLSEMTTFKTPDELPKLTPRPDHEEGKFCSRALAKSVSSFKTSTCKSALVFHISLNKNTFEN